jgi:hypothetical protein
MKVLFGYVFFYCVSSFVVLLLSRFDVAGVMCCVCFYVFLVGVLFCLSGFDLPIFVDYSVLLRLEESLGS